MECGLHVIPTTPLLPNQAQCGPANPSRTSQIPNPAQNPHRPSISGLGPSDAAPQIGISSACCPQQVNTCDCFHGWISGWGVFAQLSWLLLFYMCELLYIQGIQHTVEKDQQLHSIYRVLLLYDRVLFGYSIVTPEYIGICTDPTAESCWGKLCVFVEHMWVPSSLFAPLDLLGTGASIVRYFWGSYIGQCIANLPQINN